MQPNAPLPAIKTGPGVKDFQLIQPQDLQAMPISQYYRDIQGNIVNANSRFYYDSTYVKVGVAVPAGAKKALFTLGKTETDTQFGTTTSVGVGGSEKGEFLTNMAENGTFPGGTTFIMEGAGVQCIAPANLPTTVGANGSITAPNYTASVVIDGGNNLQMILNNLVLRYKRGEETKKSAPLIFWPSAPGLGLEGAIGSPNAGFVQNGRNGLVQFTHPVMLGFGDKFSFELENVCGAAFTPTTELLIRVVIWGTEIKTFQPY